MSKFKQIIEVNFDPENIIAEINEKSSLGHLAIMDKNSVFDSYCEDRIIKSLQDEKIGIVYTNVIVIDTNGPQVIEYLNGNDLPNISFFMKRGVKLEDYSITSENYMSELMSLIIRQGYYFEHYTQPLLKIKK